MSETEQDIKAGVEQAANDAQTLIQQSDTQPHTADTVAEGACTQADSHSCRCRLVALVLCGMCVHCGRSNYLKALQVAVSAPSGSKEQSVRDLAATSVSNVLNLIKEADIQKTVDQLTEEQRSANNIASRTNGQQQQRASEKRADWPLK